MTNPAYDPQNPDEKPKTGLMTKRDAIRIFGGLAFIAILLIPLYNKLMEDRNKYICRTHMGQVLKAMQLYATINTDRFPPAMAMDPDGRPIMSNGRANTWISVVSAMMNEPAQEFTCPAAHADEAVKNAGPSGSTLTSHFGIFGAMAAMPVGSVMNPTQTVLLSETSNNGARQTYNPLPLGAGAPDGFLIGFDNTNFLPGTSPSLFANSLYATRLAFRDTKTGTFTESTGGRHGASIHVAFVDGHIGNLSGPSAAVQHQGDEIFGRWSVR